MNHTHFSDDLINKSLEGYDVLINRKPRRVMNYEDFISKIPITYDNELSRLTENLLELKLTKSCHFNTSSATSGKRKLLPQRIWRVTSVGSYAYDLVSKIKEFSIFNDDDVVANLFSAGGLSTLYEGCNRILEACKVSILPVARLDIQKDRQNELINIMSKLNLNCLFGTPNSIINCINLAVKNNIKLNLEKIVYTGEMFHLSKIEFIRTYYPEIKIFGLYGHSETGFVGLNTPHCGTNHYHLLSNHFFFEVTENNEILITDLTNPILPMLRYYVGDHGEIYDKKCSCGRIGPLLFLKGRSDKKFNFMGNLISYVTIKNAIKLIIPKIEELQIQISTTDNCKEKLNLVLDLEQHEIKLIKNIILDELIKIDEVSEGLSKNVGEIDFLSKENFIYSDRQKLPLILDFRK